MQMVHFVIVELTNQSLQNPCNGVLTLTKNLLIGRTKILLAFIYKQSILANGCYITISVTVTVNKHDHFIVGKEI